MHAEPGPRFTAAQWLLLVVLALMQFAHIVDFLILMPLATDLQADLEIYTREFGLLVSAYAFAAGAAGLLAAPWLDRFDRKLTLLVLFVGFTLGTMACALAPDYWVLLGGRLVAGAFGGVVNSVVLAIVGDAFPASRRGTAMGAIMSAFSLASIAGVPLGLEMARHSELGWRAPFAALAMLSLVLILLAFVALPSVAGHLASNVSPAKLLDVATRPNHVRAFAFTFVVVYSGFTIFPFIAPFLEKNVGMAKANISLMYVFGGGFTLLSMNLIGRLADRFPRPAVFRVLGLLTIVPILGITHLPSGASLGLILTVTTLLFVLSSGRMVPAMAMITGSAEPRVRGSFLSINASVQQTAAGVASLLAGRMITEADKNAPLEGFPLVGLVAATAALLSVILIGMLRPADATPPAVEAVVPALTEGVA